MKLKDLRHITLFFFSGILFTFCSTDEENPSPKITTPETAISDYLNNSDTTFEWTVTSTYALAGVSAYDLRLTSQKWREHTWVHQITVLMPTNIQQDGALLWITGGNILNGEPRWAGQTDGETLAFALLANRNKTMVALLRQIPNQPFYDNRTEDALISYTLQQFKNDGDYSWPLLFPMTKSAIRAMDALQQFAEEELQIEIREFVLSGASKRGWTTWLTGAHDSRVKAIAPAVIDVLNMPVNLDYQLEVWGEYSPQIQDYVDLGIPQEVHTEQGSAISTMIDPYSYREQLTMPKLIVIGTNDPYWPVDAIKHYFSDIPGDNYIHYVANAGHDLDGGEQVLYALSAFLGNTLADRPYPICSWEISDNDGQIDFSAQGSGNVLSKAFLWSAYSEDRDFRDEHWSSAEVNIAGGGTVQMVIDYPDLGYKAFYIDLEYPDGYGGFYTKSTRMFVADSLQVL